MAHNLPSVQDFRRALAFPGDLLYITAQDIPWLLLSLSPIVASRRFEASATTDQHHTYATMPADSRPPSTCPSACFRHRFTQFGAPFVVPMQPLSADLQAHQW
ncbi:unnamed protein product [Citrullus colocynthis]|uniref:Uncharacterized protein n=1 Tax=Citrullus colocynthis TaxID=252529 RepID=A0ABP0Y472_9ROSI